MIHQGPSSRLHRPEQISALFISRLSILAALIAVMSLLLFIRLYSLQHRNHAHFATLSQENRVRVMAVAPSRGRIFDRHGRLLAGNRANYALQVLPEEIDDLDAVLARLESLIDLSAADKQQFLKTVTHQADFTWLSLRHHLSARDLARFAVDRYRFPGIDIAARPQRDYPYGAMLAHAIGYVGPISKKDSERERSLYRGTQVIGRTGIERHYEARLHGQPGFQQVEINAEGRILRVIKEQLPVPGEDLHLSLDAELQRVAADAFGTQRGALVALDPSSGELLALLSMPGFDPHLFSRNITAQQYNQLKNQPGNPLFNRALAGQYPPGSTIKPLLALAGLHHQALDPEQRFICRGQYRLGNRPRLYRDWKKEGHGAVDLRQAVAQSCDIYFYHLAQQLNIDRMAAFLAPFGLGQSTGIDSPGEQSGILPSRNWKQQSLQQPWFPGETLITGIGQGYMLATPLQLARFTAALAKQKTPPPLSLLVHAPTDDPLAPMPAISDAAWQAIRQAMIAVVHDPKGTGWRARSSVADIQIAGKTGTSQVYTLPQDIEERPKQEDLPLKLRNHALFISFAPAAEPRIAVAVVVEHGGSGGRIATPIAHKVIEYFLQHNP